MDAIQVRAKEASEVRELANRRLEHKKVGSGLSLIAIVLASAAIITGIGPLFGSALRSARFAPRSWLSRFSPHRSDVHRIDRADRWPRRLTGCLLKATNDNHRPCGRAGLPNDEPPEIVLDEGERAPLDSGLRRRC